LPPRASSISAPRSAAFASLIDDGGRSSRPSGGLTSAGSPRSPSSAPRSRRRQLPYKHFGLAEPFPLSGALEAGVIARRLPPAKMNDNTTMVAIGALTAVFERPML
jgi:hypothetical protein